MRKALWVGGAVVLLLVFALAAAILLVDVNRFRQPLQAQLEKGLRRQVALGTIGLRLIPLAITAGECSIGEASDFPTGRPFAAVGRIAVRVGLVPLLRKEVQVDSLVLERPSIELVRNREGRWNYSSLGGASSGERGGNGAFVLGRLRIEDGSVAVSELGNPKSRSVYDHVDLDLRNFGPGRIFQIAAAARLPGSASDALKIEGKGGPVRGGPMPFAGRISVDKTSLAGLMRFMSSGKAQPFDGMLSGAAEIESSGAAMKAKGALELTDLRVRNAALGYPVRLDYQIAMDSESGLVKAPRLDLKVGNVPIALSAELNTKSSAMKGGLKVARASLAEVLALTKAFGTADLSGSGVVSLDARIQGPYDRPEALSYSGTGALENATLRTPALTRPLAIRTANLTFDEKTATLENVVASLGSSTLRGRMTARNATVPDIAFGFNIDKLDIAELQQTIGGDSGTGAGASGAPPRGLSARGSIDVGTILVSGVALNQVHSDVALNNGVLTLAPLTAGIFGGKETGSITIDMRAQPAKVALDTQLAGVDAQKLLAATTPMKQTVYGLLAAGMNANLSLAPGDEMARTLNGSLNLQLTNGRLAGVNILNQLAEVAKFLGYGQNSQPYTDIVQLAGDLKIVNGLASTDNLRLQIEGATLAGTGTMNLVTQALDLRLTAVLDRAMSQKVGGTRIGGFLTTALANGNGELVIPALVKGTFAQPRFMPDASRVAEMKLKNLLPGSIGSMEGGLPGVLKSPGAAKPADAVQGVLGAIDALRGRGEKSAPKKP